MNPIGGGTSVPLIGHTEQECIVSALKSIDSKISHQRKIKSSYNSLFKTMLHELMTGKIRVKDIEL